MKLDRYLLILMAVGAVFMFVHLGKLYVDIMEARNLVSAREMVDHGNWIFTTMNGVPRYEKPPLPTWLSAVMGKFFGWENIGMLRFPAALSCLLIILYLYKIVGFLTKNSKLAFISALIFASSFLVIYVGRRANWDIFSYSFMVIGLYYFIVAMNGTRKWVNFAVAGVLFGLSVLSKGPTGPYVLLMPYLGAFLLVNGFPKPKLFPGILLCALITVLVGLSWYLYIYFADAEIFTNIMKKEALARENRDVKPFTRYLSFPVQMGVWAIFSVLGLFFPMMKNKAESPKIYMLFFWWTLISLVLLSIIPSKKERYLFPLMVPLAVTTGFYVYSVIESYSLKKWEKKLNTIIFVILGVIALALGFGIIFLPVITDLYLVLFGLLSFLAGVAIIYFAAVQKNFSKAFYMVVVLMLNTAIFGLPVVDKMLSNNLKRNSLTTLKPQLEKQGLKMYTFNEYSPEVWFRYGEIMPEIKSEDSSSFPKEKVFYMASNTNDPAFYTPLKKLNWQLQLVGIFDDNEQAAPSKNHSDRKIHYVYKVTKP